MIFGISLPAILLQLGRIGDLELKNQELEKFQYVLQYKIDELTRLIHPRTMEIDHMRNQLIEVKSVLPFLCEEMELLNMKKIPSIHLIQFSFK